MPLKVYWVEFIFPKKNSRLYNKISLRIRKKESLIIFPAGLLEIRSVP